MGERSRQPSYTGEEATPAVVPESRDSGGIQNHWLVGALYPQEDLLVIILLQLNFDKVLILIFFFFHVILV